MKIKSLLLTFVLFFTISLSSYANWGNNNWGNGWYDDWNPYSAWDPRYWFEEMENIFDDDWDTARYNPYYGNYNSYGNNNPYIRNNSSDKINKDLFPKYNPYLVNKYPY